MTAFGREVKRRAGLGPRRPAFFDALWYRTVHADVADSGMDPLRHYLAHGRFEGRRPCALTAADRERDLRGGWLAEGEAALGRLLEDTSAAERLWAALALARWRADAGDWPGADRLLRQADPDGTALAGGFGLADPPLLAAEAAVAAGDPGRAATILQAARRALGPLPDLALARANVAAAQHGFGRAWRGALAGLYLRAGLPGLAVAAGPGPAFDRLMPGWPPLPRRRGPTVSVIVPARNAAATIAAALRGLSQQSWQDLEIIVVDNGSTDGTVGAVHAAMAADPRIRLIDGSAAPGAYGARNLGLAAAGGAFVTVQDADDWSHPARIARQVRALQRDPAAAASVSFWTRATPDLRFTRWWGQDGHLHRNVSSLMLRREATAALGFWDRVRAGADTEYWDRCLARFGPRAIVATAPTVPLAIGRRSDGSLSRGEASIESQHRGARRDYHLAARRWHARTPPAALHMAAVPPHRAFPAPAALGPADPPPEVPTEDERLAQCPLLDADWMLRTQPDLRLSGADPVRHYLERGAAEGRDPGPRFSTSGYRLLHPDAGPVPLRDHLQRTPPGQPPAPVLPDLEGALPCPPGRPRVLFVAHRAGAAVFGAERSLLDMLDHAAGAGLVPLVLLPQALDPGYLAALRARSHRVFLRPFGWRYGGFAPEPAGVAHALGILRDWQVAEVHQNTGVVDIGPAAARAAGIPAVVHLRELPAEDPQLCRDLGLTAAEWRDLLLAEADRLVANSALTAAWLDRPDRTVILPNAVPEGLDHLPAPPGRFSADRPLRLGLIGSLEPRKGLAAAWRLARDIGRTGLPAEVVLIGPATAALTRLGPAPPALRHAGPAAGPAAAMAEVDVVLSLSSFAESWGRTVAEGLAAGRPAIVHDRGMPPELVGRDGRAGLVVPPDDPAALLAAAARLAGQPGSVAAMAAEARTRARQLSAGRAAVPAAAVYPCLAGQRPAP